MADEFAIRPEAVAALRAALEGEEAHSLAAAVPAAIVAGVWQALLAAGAVTAPDGIDVTQARVRAVDRHLVALSVPLRPGFEATRGVRVPRLHRHDLHDALEIAAQRLRETLHGAVNDALRDYGESEQKPYG